MTALVTGSVIESYRVLAGHAGGLSTLNNVTVPSGHSLLLLGGKAGSYYAALGQYGVYRIAGSHAYQLCAYGAPEAKRNGVTSTDRSRPRLCNFLRPGDARSCTIRPTAQ